MPARSSATSASCATRTGTRWSSRTGSRSIRDTSRPRSILPGPAELWSTSGGARALEMQNTRLVTVLFTDVEGSTRLLAALGDAFVALIERQREILTNAVTAHRGGGYPTGCDGCIFV